MKKTFITIIIDALGKEIGGLRNKRTMETIQTNTLLRSARILRRVLES